VVTSESGESLPWIDRLAGDMHRLPGLVADDLGLRVVVNAQRFVSLLFGIVAAEEDRAAVRAATGVSAEVLDGMHLSVYDGTVLDLSDLAADKVGLQRVRLGEWALFTTSRACPDCLAASGGVWQLWWRLAAAAVCPAHRLVLAGYCPGGAGWTCGAVPTSIRGSRLGRSWSRRPCAPTGSAEVCAGTR
jgi:hypothetical protein